MKLNIKIIYSAIAIAGITMATVALSQKHKTMNHSDMKHTSGMEHSSDMEYSCDMEHTSGMKHNVCSADNLISIGSSAVLSEAGTDPFAVIQEAIALLGQTQIRIGRR